MKEGYYNSISGGYDELHKEEQLQKCRLIAENFDFKNKKILDVGCGTGIAADFFKCDTGVDPSEKLLEIASEKYPNIQFIEASAESLPFEDDEFDAVISVTAIQNFEDIEKGLSEIKRVGKEFVLTFLRRSEKKEEIEGLIKKLFRIKKIVEEEKDMLYFCGK
jgi:ubiquinone/menaquinone biosynthesis C-methylase UbiE